MNVFSAGKRRVYDTIKMIHDVITTANSFPYTTKFMFFGVRNSKTQQVRR